LQITSKIKNILPLPMPKQKRKSDCPIYYALELFGDRWTFLLIRDMMFKGKQYYGEFLQSEEKIATNILADRLLLLENAGIVTKNTDPKHGAKYIYKLTQKGIDLMPVLVEVIMWSAQYDTNTATDPQFVKRAKKDKENLLKEITLHLQKELEG
jgi:DNA-binding HxlR family transcriptional regulator